MSISEKLRTLPSLGFVVLALYFIESIIVLATNYLPYQGEAGFKLASVESIGVIAITLGLFAYFVKLLVNGSKVIIKLHYVLLCINVIPVLLLTSGNSFILEAVDYVSLFSGLLVLAIIMICRTPMMKEWLVQE